MHNQTLNAISSSSLIIFLCDARTGFSHQDNSIAQLIRSSAKPVILAVNKVDNSALSGCLSEFYEAGLGDPLPLSALHKKGLSRLFESIRVKLPDAPATFSPVSESVKIAIVGRPNVGKSSFFNRLLGFERVIVDRRAGTTRDSVDTLIHKNDECFLIIDTAGLKKKFSDPVEYFSSLRTHHSIDKSQVCLLLLDPTEGILTEDVKIFNLVRSKGRACLIVVNKWDLMKDISQKKYKKWLLETTPLLGGVPIIFASAARGEGMEEALRESARVSKKLNAAFKTSKLNKIIEKHRNALKIKIYYMVQVKTFPKTFVIFVNNPKAVKTLHKRTLENILRKELLLYGIPVVLEFRNRNAKKGLQ